MIQGLVAILLFSAAALPPASFQFSAPSISRSLPAKSREPNRGEAAAENSLQVLLVTIGEGKHYFEKFGHNALWFRDTSRGIDVAYNWGVFNFQEPGFLARLLLGDSKYWVEGVPGPLLLDFYQRSDRSIVVQRLNLTPEQARKAFDFAQWNAREENKFYRYDYFRDNCSTRVRDLIDLALGGALKRATSGQILAATYRGETLRLVDDMKLTQFGIDVALGRPADRPLSTWDNMFVPSKVRDAMRELRVPDSSGKSVPVVAEERTVYESRSHQERPDVPGLWVPYLLVGLLLGGELVAVAVAGRRSGAAEKAFRIEVAVWSLITGVLGLIVLLAWLISRHVFWYQNENLLLLNPLSLFLAALALLSIRRPRWTRQAAICAVIVAMVSALGLILKGIGSAQDNLPLVLLFVPAHFAIAYGLWRRATRGMTA